MKQSGAKLLINALKQENIDIIFGYPGGAVIPIFDELYAEPSIKVVLPRHEQGLIHMADGYARSTGKTGVCLVTSGPGTTNIVTGIATANYDSVPLVCFAGQVPIPLIGNDAFQEVDTVGLTRSIAKHNYVVSDRKDLPRIIKEAFYIASSGRPGPVVIGLPLDIIKAVANDAYPKEIKIEGYDPVTDGNILQIKKAASKLMKAERPIFLCGGGINISNASEKFTELAEKTDIPVVTTLMGIGSIPAKHPLHVGMVGMHGAYSANMALTHCDLIFSIGCRFSDRITGKISEFATKAEIVHIDIDPVAISRNVPVAIPIVGDARSVIKDLLLLVKKCDTSSWKNKINKWRKDHTLKIVEGQKRLSPMKIIDSISKVFPDAIIATDVGQHQMWTAQFYDFKYSKSFLTSGGLGTMGYGLPAALGAQVGNKGKRVLCISGDGGFQMNIQELTTASQEKLPIIIIILNNHYLGMVREWQELFFDKNYSSTCLSKTASCPHSCNSYGSHCPPYIPDFVKVAEGFGVVGMRVTEEQDIIPCLEKASNIKDKPVLIEFLVEQEANVLPIIPAGSAISEMLL